MSEKTKKKPIRINLSITEKESSIIVQALDNQVKTMNEENYVYGRTIDNKCIETIDKITEKICEKIQKEKIRRKSKNERKRNEK